MRNGVDTATLFATLDAVKQASEAARFQFRARRLLGDHPRGQPELIAYPFSLTGWK